MKRLLLTRAESAELCGVSLSHFERHIQPHIDWVYSGQLRLCRPRDLERWVDSQVTTTRGSARPDDDEAGR